MNIYRKIISFTLALVLVFSMVFVIPTASAETTNSGATIELTAQSNYGYAFEVLRQVNELRSSSGLGALKMNPQMLEDAMQRSAELAVKFSHTRPDGSPCFTVNNEILSENIALGQMSPTAVMESWINSPGHYANIMTSYYDSIGIGAVIHNGVTYWTQIFGISSVNGAATCDEVTEDEFSVYLGDNQYTVELIAPVTLFEGDKCQVTIQGENSEWRTFFRLNNNDFVFTTDSPDILNITNDEIEALSAGTATITASNSALTVSATVEVVEFSKGQSRQCGDNVFWDYKNGTLILSGSGKMYDYNTETGVYGDFFTDVPWTDGFAKVDKIIIGEGITYIGNRAFARFTDLSEIELPSTLESIGEYAFARCIDLISVSFPDSVSDIGEGAFYGCYYLKDINIPEEVKVISHYMFDSCFCLNEIKLPDSLEAIGNRAFYSCESLQSIVLPENLNSIGYSAFAYCDSLESITIPYSVETLYSSTFYNCDSLTTLKIENPALSFGADDMFITQAEALTVYGYKNSSAEKYCNLNGLNFVPLEGVILNAELQDGTKVYDSLSYNDDLIVHFESTPDEYSVKYSKGEDFDFNNSFVSIDALVNRYNTVYEPYLTNSGTYPISYCIYSKGCEPVIGKAEIVIEKVTPEFIYEKSEVEIPYYTREYNYKTIINPLSNLGLIKAYDIEYTSDNTLVADVSTGGYVYARGIGECTITATYPGDNNFNSHSVSFKVTTYPVGRYQIEDYVFNFKEDKTATLIDYYGTGSVITVPTEAMNYNISEISHGAFYSADFEEVIIPEGITHIGTSAFSSCVNLKEVKLSDTVSTIDEYAFNYCKSLENITIPESVASIMEGAFMGCDSMNSIVIPSSVSYIGEKALGYNQYYYDGDTVKNKDFVIYGHKDTASERYATENGFKFVDLDAPVPAYETGDVNRNGSVNIKDATAIQKFIASLESFDDEQMLLADFNEDASVNIKDATEIQKKIAGMI